METKIFLDENEMPKQWYNIIPRFKTPLDPPLHPETKKPIGPDDLKAIFPMELIRQEVSDKKQIPIPEEVRDVLTLWRPSPLYRAHHLEKFLKTPAKIYYKWEGVSPAGSHKPNSSVPQAYYNMKEGISRLATETGAGQWGSALAFATQLYDMECTVYMVKSSYNQKPYRRVMMELWGASCHESPTSLTECGKKIRVEYPDTPGSLGIAISEAVEDAATHENTNYALGSVLNHVCLHQTIIGLEAKEQLAKVDEYPDVVVGCVGGGSNFAGISFPFAGDKIDGRNPDVDLIGVEPTACPTLTKGIFEYDYGDVAGLTPMLKMYTLGSSYIPPALHAGGLRYHGDSPLVSKLVHDGIARAIAYPQAETFEAARTFARTEGFIIAPESSHAVKAAIDIALECRKTGEEKCILFNMSGHGNLDMMSYHDYMNGHLDDHGFSESDLKTALAQVPQI